jgi:hypothetical protein
MKVLICEKDQKWHRAGNKITYFQNNIKRDNTASSRFYYTL